MTELKAPKPRRPAPEAIDLSGLRASRRRFSLPRPDPARMAWRVNAASLGATTVVATVAFFRSEPWGAMAVSLCILVFLSSALVYRILGLRRRELRP
ncbi:MAG: hypothetical protein QOE92_440 [Chloroflexota bacterium]|nr:hypothetical protein [Chloroflexota bacterium]